MHKDRSMTCRSWTHADDCPPNSTGILPEVRKQAVNGGPIMVLKIFGL